MKSLSSEVAKITRHLEEFKRLRANMPKAEKVKVTYQDFRHLNHDNLEDHDMIHQAAAYFKTKQIPYCGRCGEGFIYSVCELGNRFATLCKYCERPRRRLKKLNDLQLPYDAIGMHLGRYEFDSQEQFDKVKTLVTWLNTPKDQRDDVSPSIYLWGAPGNGKTSLLYALAKQAIFSDHRVMFTTHTQLIDQIKRTFKGKDDNPLDQWLAKTDLLLFDEFGGIGGGANMTDWFKSTTIDIIQRIYERWAAGKLSIVMTTNLTPDELFNRALNRNKAGASRLQAIFKKPIYMQGRDRRGDNGDLSAWGVK